MKVLLTAILTASWLLQSCLSTGTDRASEQGVSCARGGVVPAQPPARIRLGVSGSLAEAASYLAEGEGYFAREGLNVVTIVFANRIYQILRGEIDGVGAGEPGQRAQDMLRIDRPTLDFVALARGMGVPGRAVTTADEFNKALEEAVREPGPRLIEVQF